MKVPLKYVSESCLHSLREGIRENLSRYQEGSFEDLERQNGWAIEAASVKVDYDKLGEVICAARSAEDDVRNSSIVYDALDGMTPAVAREERVWVRLTHVECLIYARTRWLGSGSNEKQIADVSTHFFASTMTAVRDDNAISRLWWNMYYARILDPSDPADALRHVAGKADMRSNLLERSQTASRLPLARAILNAIRSNQWLTGESNFREFMKVINRRGGGILFEVLPEKDVEGFVRDCLERAQRNPAGRLVEERATT
jgi:hypothetical protein